MNWKMFLLFPCMLSWCTGGFACLMFPNWKLAIIIYSVGSTISLYYMLKGIIPPLNNSKQAVDKEKDK